MTTPCDCLNECGDDPRVQAGTAKRCADFDHLHPPRCPHCKGIGYLSTTRPQGHREEPMSTATATRMTAIALTSLPAIGQPLDDGTFVGLTTTRDGTHHAVVLLAENPGKKLQWTDAMAWAESVDGQLPSRPVAALLFANARSHFDKAWYWTNESHEDDGSYAWNQVFDDGYQINTRKSYEGRARAVRLIQLTA